MVKLSSARWRRSTPQKMVKKFTDALLGDPNLRAKIESIVCFGSAARPRDFIEGLSDIDVLVLVRRKSEHLTDASEASRARPTTASVPPCFRRLSFCGCLMPEARVPCSCCGVCPS